MIICDVPLSKVWQLRHEVMYPESDVRAVQLDNDTQGIHLGVHSNTELLSVISLFGTDKELQFRKFATRVAFQRQGVGSFLLNHVITWAKTNGFELIWCNARLSATSLYKRFGMETVGESWIRNEIEYIKMQKEL